MQERALSWLAADDTIHIEQKQGSNLPSVAKENLAKAYGDLSAVLKTDKPIADKTKDVVHFVHESLQPILDSAWKVGPAYCLLTACQYSIFLPPSDYLGYEGEGRADRREGAFSDSCSLARSLKI